VFGFIAVHPLLMEAGDEVQGDLDLHSGRGNVRRNRGHTPDNAKTSVSIDNLAFLQITK
jgi:hypothetical protein